MSTEHISAELATALEASKALKAKNDRERKQLLDDQAKADQALVDNVEAAVAVVRAAQQQHEDDSEQRQHRLAQANRIAAGVSDPAPEPEPQAPIEPAPTVVDHDNDAAGNPPTVVVPVVVAPAPEPQAPPSRNNGDPRNWRGIAWLLGIVGAFIGLIVARVTYEPMWSEVNNDFWHTVLVVLWFIALIAAGFFTGGWFGATREEERRNNPQPNPAPAAE